LLIERDKKQKEDERREELAKQNEMKKIRQTKSEKEFSNTNNTFNTDLSSIKKKTDQDSISTIINTLTNDSKSYNQNQILKNK